MAEVLLTGYPAFTARVLCRRLIASGDRVLLLARHRFAEEAERFLAACGGSGDSTVLIGDIVQMDLGLTGPEVRRLLREVEAIYHLAAIHPRSPRTDQAHSVNVDGTRTILELALGATKLQRFNFFSTALVSGDRQGVVLEEELDRGQRFRNEFERTKLDAERLVRRAAADIPVSVFRPSLVVGHSQTGEIDPLDDPYQWMTSFLKLPVDVSVPLPGRGDYPLNLVPVDYVCDAAVHIAKDPRGVGRTFHLTDPNPLPARRVVELLADHGQRRRPRGSIPASLARRLVKLPIFDKLGPTRELIDQMNQLVIYNTSNTLELLSGTGTRCPPFESYVATLVAFLQHGDRIGEEAPHDDA